MDPKEMKYKVSPTGAHISLRLIQRTGGVTQVAECMPSKPKALRSNCSTAINK
jgi:hypothetical protein